MERKPVWIVGVLLLLVGAFFGWPHLQWFRYRLEAQKQWGDKKLGRFPSTQDILAQPKALKELGKAKGFDDIDVKMTLREEVHTGDAKWWFLRAKVRSGTKVIDLERRIERDPSDGYEELEEGGVTLQVKD